MKRNKHRRETLKPLADLARMFYMAGQRALRNVKERGTAGSLLGRDVLFLHKLAEWHPTSGGHQLTERGEILLKLLDERQKAWLAGA